MGGAGKREKAGKGIRQLYSICGIKKEGAGRGESEELQEAEAGEKVYKSLWKQ